jgi:hypothetical protein
MHEANSMLKLPTDLFWPLPGGAEAPVFTEFWSLLALARMPPEPLDEPAAQPAATSRSPASRAAAAPTRRDWPRLREVWVIGAVCMSASPLHILANSTIDPERLAAEAAHSLSALGFGSGSESKARRRRARSTVENVTTIRVDL